MTIKTRALLLATLAAVATLTACGGNDRYEEPAAAVPETKVPASASASPQAWLQHASMLKSSESAEPLDVNESTPPTSETDEPQAL